jgi:hypothetical protein
VPSLFVIGGSDAGVSAALRARELASSWTVSVAVARGLNDLDLSYTPPLSAPWDPVQVAAQTWSARNTTLAESSATQ